MFNKIAASPKDVENPYTKELKRNAPYASFGVGAGGGMWLANSKFKGNKAASVAIPIAMGSAAYLAGNKAVGNKIDSKTMPVLTTLGGGAAAVAAHDTIARAAQGGKASFKFNPLVRNSVGSAGAILGGMAAIALFNKKKKEHETLRKDNIQKR